MSYGGSMEWVEYTKVNTEITRNRERVVVEFSLSILVDERHLTTALITPMMMEEFVVGHLFWQEAIDTAADVKSIAIEKNVANVTLHKRESGVKRSSEKTPDFKVSRDDIFRGVNAILKSKIYAETEAIHSAGLFQQGAEPVCIAEDVGRHNALDKVIGYGLINNVDFSNVFAASTGRMVSDMVRKICRANIPVVATKTAVTNIGIEIAKRHGLTIAGFVRDKGMKKSTDSGEKIIAERSMKVYTSPERII
ncbi:MAG: formate dehydrogenase accessory sulfurtransferase FdhD [Dehalococcoidia bacterium]